MTSRHASAAKLIRQELKAAHPEVKFTVRSDSYSGGSSIRVGMTDQPPAVRKSVEAIVSKYEYGHFDGSQDLYEMSNVRNDIPQVKFIFVDNDRTDEMMARIDQHIKDTWSADCLTDPRNYSFVQSLPWQLFTGAQEGFWGQA